MQLNKHWVSLALIVLAGVLGYVDNIGGLTACLVVLLLIEVFT